MKEKKEFNGLSDKASDIILVVITAIVVLIVAMIVAIGSQTFLGACVHDDGSFGACHWACRALLGEGILLAVLALAALAFKREMPGLYLAMMPASLLGMLTPGTLIAICKAPTMRCRMVQSLQRIN